MPNFIEDPLVQKAARLAAQKHKGQIRKGRDECPYIDHLKSVARVIAEENWGRGLISDYVTLGH